MTGLEQLAAFDNAAIKAGGRHKKTTATIVAGDVDWTVKLSFSAKTGRAGVEDVFEQVKEVSAKLVEELTGGGKHKRNVYGPADAGKGIVCKVLFPEAKEEKPPKNPRIDGKTPADALNGSK